MTVMIQAPTRAEPLALARTAPLVSPPEACLRSISAIVPTLNEESTLRPVLERLLTEPNVEVIVVDGGSSDATRDIASTLGATVIATGRGRSSQMNSGADSSSGDALIFVHADTLLEPGWSKAVLEVLGDPTVAVGAFRFATDISGLAMRIIERLVAVRSDLLRTPYGDQALFVRRNVFEDVGGFPVQPLAEDYEFVRRARRRGAVRIVHMPAVTSGRMWRRLGIARMTWRNSVVLVAYHLKMDLNKVAQWRRR